MTDLHPPSMVNVANIHTALQDLSVPMAGWWWEPHCEDLGGDSTYGMTVAPEALTDTEATSMAFVWDEQHGWTMDDACDGMGYGPVRLDIPDPYDVTAVAAHFKAVIDGEINEFRRAA
jgi:hypothetical protein